MSTYNEYIGKIRKVVFYSEQTKYIVARIEEENLMKQITITGNMLSYKENQRYKFIGEETFHPRYGKQVKIVSYEEMIATDHEEVIAYLSSSQFKGIGKVLATRIVDQLGENTISKIIEDKTILQGISGLSAEKIDMIYNVLIEDNRDSQTVQYLMKYNFNMGIIDKMIKTYEDETLNMIQSHPYKMIEAIDGLSFRMIDRYALSIGYDEDNDERIEALIIYVIQEYCFQNGHTYIEEDTLFNYLGKYDDAYMDLYKDKLLELIEAGKIFLREDKYFLASFEYSEEGITEILKGFMVRPREQYDSTDIEREIKNMESRMHIEYSKSQKDAIHDFLSYPVMILTGGPGTGKTTLVKACIEIYNHLNEQKNIVLTAPTGRAAKRLSELTNQDSSTIHRLLKWDMNTNEFGLNEENPIPADLLIIDEFSMVDTFLFYHLLKASSQIQKILIIGDDQQLPSVMPGQLLHDLLQIEAIHFVELKEIFRQKQDSGIINLAHHLRNNDLIEPEFFSEYNDVHFLDNNHIFESIEKLVVKAINEGYDPTEIQVLAPMYKGEVGIDALNAFLQNILNPHDEKKTEIKVGNKIYREGDKVLQLKNRVDDNVFNGDIGFIEEIHFKGLEYASDTVVINYDGNYVEYGSTDFIEFTHAYCISIHKSQGSEFKIVLLVLTLDFYPMLQKKLIYTALTRAKNSLIILGDYRAFRLGIEEGRDRVRHTYLKERFSEHLETKEESGETLSPFDFMDEQFTEENKQEALQEELENNEDDLSPFDFM